MKHNTRFAPSPTGDLHLGGVRTAYHNWLVSRSTGGKFHLRIDDTDKTRNDDSKVQDIFDILYWLKIDYDSVVRQSDRYDRYREIVDYLIFNGKARMEDGCVRLNYDGSMVDCWSDTVAGKITLSDDDKNAINNLVILRSDQSPTYHLASVVDDIDLDINHIIRGTDHISNTTKQVAIFHALKAPLPLFTHVGLLTKNKKKLSKRDKAASTLQYKNDGYDPRALKAWVLRMGWGPKVDDKKNSMLDTDRALDLILDGGSFRNSNASLDEDKLNAFHRKFRSKDGYVVPKDMSDMIGVKY